MVKSVRSPGLSACWSWAVFRNSAIAYVMASAVMPGTIPTAALHLKQEWSFKTCETLSDHNGDILSHSAQCRDANAKACLARRILSSSDRINVRATRTSSPRARMSAA